MSNIHIFLIGYLHQNSQKCFSLHTLSQSQKPMYNPKPQASVHKSQVQKKFIVRQGQDSSIDEVVTGVAFKPFKEAQGQQTYIQQGLEDSKKSYARTGYHPECELAVNEQINKEWTNSYVYHALYAFFARSNVGLPKIAQYFKNNSDEERTHADTLMQYQNRRGGKVALKPVLSPELNEFWGAGDKTDALLAFELALALERLNFINLRKVQAVGDKNDDPEFTDFIEDMLSDQADDIYVKANHVAKLRRIGNDGHGVFNFDNELELQA